MGLFDADDLGPLVYPLKDATPLRHWPLWCAEDRELLVRLTAEIPWEQHELRMGGGMVPAPRLEFFGAMRPGATYGYSGERYVGHDLVRFPVLLDLLARVRRQTDEPFNAVFANLYRDGRDSIGYHADDEPSLGPPFDVVIASLSLGARRSFSLRHRDGGKAFTLGLGFGDLLLMGRGTQSSYLHSVPKISAPIGPRINLTFRSLR